MIHVSGANIIALVETDVARLHMGNRDFMEWYDCCPKYKLARVYFYHHYLSSKIRCTYILTTDLQL